MRKTVAPPPPSQRPYGPPSGCQLTGDLAQLRILPRCPARFVTPSPRPSTPLPFFPFPWLRSASHYFVPSTAFHSAVRGDGEEVVPTLSAGNCPSSGPGVHFVTRTRTLEGGSCCAAWRLPAERQRGSYASPQLFTAFSLVLRLYTLKMITFTIGDVEVLNHKTFARLILVSSVGVPEIGLGFQTTFYEFGP